MMNCLQTPDGKLYLITQFESPLPSPIYVVELEQDKVGDAGCAWCAEGCVWCFQAPLVAWLKWMRRSKAEVSRCHRKMRPAGGAEQMAWRRGVRFLPHPPSTLAERPMLVQETGQLTPISSKPVNLTSLGGGWNICAGQVTPWGTHIGGECWHCRRSCKAMRLNHTHRVQYNQRVMQTLLTSCHWTVHILTHSRLTIPLPLTSPYRRGVRARRTPSGDRHLDQRLRAHLPPLPGRGGPVPPGGQGTGLITMMARPGGVAPRFIARF